MTTVAGYCRVRPGDRESRKIVIVIGRTPCRSRVAFGAHGRESGADVIGIRHAGVVAVMAGVASRRRTRVSGGVAAIACYGRVSPGEREPGQIMVKGCRRPSTGRVALLAQC